MRTVDSVELFRILCVVLRVLTSNGKVHGVPSADITSNHTLVSNILPNLPLQLGFYFEVA